MTVTADDLDAALDSVVAALGPAAGQDWGVAAGALEWTCRHTAEHLGDCLLSYAFQLVAQPPQRYVKFLASVDADATPAETLEFAEAGGRLLVSALRTAAPGTRAHHPTGYADLEGWAGMGCIETLLHGDDIATGLGVKIEAPQDICSRVLARMFPEQAPLVTDVDPWTGLRWCAGRLALPDRPQRTGWRWRGDPLDA